MEKKKLSKKVGCVFCGWLHFYDENNPDAPWKCSREGCGNTGKENFEVISEEEIKALNIQDVKIQAVNS